MTRISQVIAVVAGVKTDVTRQIGAVEDTLGHPELFDGLEKTYRPRNEPGPGDPPALVRPPQVQRVQATADGTLATIETLMTRLLDTTRTLDESNAVAFADVIVDSVVVLPRVTTGHLLYLEKELLAMHALVSKFPVLKQAETWTDEDTEPGQYKTPAVETASTDKVFFNHTLAPPDEHGNPAQVQIMTRDDVVGFWTTVKFSGALPARRKRQLLDRIMKLYEAVKMAREEANSGDVTDTREGKLVFDYLLRG